MENKLEKALSDAQFFNGTENFENRKLLYDTINDNLKNNKFLKNIDT